MTPLHSTPLSTRSTRSTPLSTHHSPLTTLHSTRLGERLAQEPRQQSAGQAKQALQAKDRPSRHGEPPGTVWRRAVVGRIVRQPHCLVLGCTCSKVRSRRRRRFRSRSRTRARCGSDGHVTSGLWVRVRVRLRVRVTESVDPLQTPSRPLLEAPTFESLSTQGKRCSVVDWPTRRWRTPESH